MTGINEAQFVIEGGEAGLKKKNTSTNDIGSMSVSVMDEVHLYTQIYLLRCSSPAVS